MSARRARPLVEILSFDGCPHAEEARALVERVADELEVEPTVRLVRVEDAAVAERERFPGSPTIRIDGRDVDPTRHGLPAYSLSCRVYRTPDGLAGLPPRGWIADALRRTTR